MTLLLWLAAVPLRFLAALGLRRTIILVCLFVLAVTAYGVAEDLGLPEPPAQAAPAPRRPAAGQPRPSQAATAAAFCSARHGPSISCPSAVTVLRICGSVPRNTLAAAS